MMEFKVQHLVIFDLPAVVNYDHLPLRRALVAAVEETLNLPLVLQNIPWNHNTTGVVAGIVEDSIGRPLQQEEWQAVKASFLYQLKQYFLQYEEPFDVWPGIQNILEQCHRLLDWDYIIVSDYWRDATGFILDSCGIFSRQMKLYTAEAGDAASTVLARGLLRDGYHSPQINTYLLTRHLQLADLPFAREDWVQIPPPYLTRAGRMEYPRFARLFDRVTTGIDS